MTGWVWFLSRVIIFHPKTGLVVPILGPHELCMLFNVAALRSCMVATIADSTVSAAIHEGRVSLMLLARGR